MHAEDEHGHRRTLLRLRPLKSRAARSQRFRRGVYLLPSAFTMANMFCGYARMTGTTSAFGVEFDSLADVISFGVAPAILSFRWGLEPLGQIGWAAGFLFVSAAAVRLARFNIQSGTQDKRYFVGLPSPAAAVVPAATVFAYPAGFQGYFEAWPVISMMIVPALLMVSTIRYRSFKSLDL